MSRRKRRVVVASVVVTLAAVAGYVKVFTGSYDKPLDWKLVGVDGRTMTVTYMDGPCAPFDRFDLQETGEGVTLGVEARVRKGNYVCPTIGIGHFDKILLASPLGDRPLWHAPDGTHDGRVLDSSRGRPPPPASRAESHLLRRARRARWGFTA